MIKSHNMKGHLLNDLFIESKGYITALEGRRLEEFDGTDNVLSASSTQPFLKHLSLVLQEVHPEAGAPYWRVRSWGLSCWQPIYLALICVYHLKKTPQTLDQLHQDQQHNYIAGYALPEGKWFHAEHHELVAYTARKLAVLFEAYEAAHLALYGGRKTLYRALLADQIMDTVLLADPFASIETISHEYTLWAKHLDLPIAPLNRLQKKAEKVSFIRRTCCLHFRRNDGEICSNCPRQHKQSQHKQCQDKNSQETLCLN
ncbi:siderophore ferric iron reductase [Marinomonas sp. 5E14-1]|uniref:siderophore ferric iron reductase n=1 Tax=Marinomonas sp. 5E14-1 TaxID=3153922 RepID=UPI00326688ED